MSLDKIFANTGEIFRCTNASGKVVGSIWHVMTDYYWSEKINMVACEDASAHIVAGILGYITHKKSQTKCNVFL